VSWDAINRMGIVLRPYNDPPPSGGTWSPFDSSFSSTLSTLARELDHLHAKTIVLQVGYRDQDLRMDGMPRANSRMLHDAVALSFESKWGPLRYETNEFVARGYKRHSEQGWQVNLRAIALGMEALRKVDRYGVSKRGEQYTGWRQLGAASSESELPQTPGEAAAAVHSVVSDLYDIADIHDDGSAGAGAHAADAIREAIMRAHPDKGGDALTFRRVMRARELLDA
jgi:hypothetical protein